MISMHVINLTKIVQESVHILERRRLHRSDERLNLRAGLRWLGPDRLDAQQHGGEGRHRQQSQPPVLRGGRPRQGGPGGAVPRRGLLRRHPRLRGPGQRCARRRRRLPGAGRAPRRQEIPRQRDGRPAAAVLQRHGLIDLLLEKK